MILLNVHPKAVPYSDKLSRLLSAKPSDFTVLKARNLSNLIESHAAPDRTEVPTKLSIKALHTLRDLAVVLLQLDPRTPSLEAVPLLFEGIYFKYINFNDPIVHDIHALSRDSYLKAVTVPLQTLTDYIDQIPLPTVPIIFNPPKRNYQTSLKLPHTTVSKLLEISKCFITNRHTTRMDSLALEWVLTGYPDATLGP